MKLKYHGYNWPWQCMTFWEWLADGWHVSFEGPVVEERGFQVCGLYFIWQRKVTPKCPSCAVALSPGAAHADDCEEEYGSHVL